MRRNWTNVRRIACVKTRLALATCSDARALKGLRSAFPDCFEEGEEEKIVWSMVRAAWKGPYSNLMSHQSHHGRDLINTTWDLCLKKLPIKRAPLDLRFGRGREERHPDIPSVIQDQLRQLLGRVSPPLQANNMHFPAVWFLSPPEIDYLGQRWRISYMCSKNGDELRLPDRDGGLLCMVPEEHILFDR